MPGYVHDIVMLGYVHHIVTSGFVHHITTSDYVCHIAMLMHRENEVLAKFFEKKNMMIFFLCHKDRNFELMQ
jgi:hypothetical protein